MGYWLELGMGPHHHTSCQRLWCLGAMEQVKFMDVKTSMVG